MRRIALIALALGGPALADGTESYTVDFSHGFDGEILSMARFDTQGGTRELVGMSLTYDQSIDLALHVESNGYTAVSAGDWSVFTSYASIHQFGLVDNDPNPPFIGPGATSGEVTGDLGISDGFNGSGPDTYFTTISSGQFSLTYDYSGSTDFGVRMLNTFTGEGSFDTFFSGYTELFGGWINDPGWVVDPNNPPDGPFSGPFEEPYYGFFLQFDELDHHGSITVNFEYRSVPAPAAAGLLGFAGLLGARRRRR